jgi:hypothetical protein
MVFLGVFLARGLSVNSHKLFMSFSSRPSREPQERRTETQARYPRNALARASDITVTPIPSAGARARETPRRLGAKAACRASTGANLGAQIPSLPGQDGGRRGPRAWERAPPPSACVVAVRQFSTPAGLLRCPRHAPRRSCS